ncbi:hypothetical protein D5086_012349 [Populus alba]|uniref:Uncharacterized protein n=1 Tax=Populus alba TaxID=43335 RepID=A0ACC4C3Q0_POPAL
MKPLLEFFSQIGSPFCLNAYPFLAYTYNPENIDINYALFEKTNGIYDMKTDLHYDNMLDAQIDAAYAALEDAGFKKMEPGPTSERNFGLFKPDGSISYDIGFHGLKSSSADSSLLSLKWKSKKRGKESSTIPEALCFASSKNGHMSTFSPITSLYGIL